MSVQYIQVRIGRITITDDPVRGSEKDLSELAESIRLLGILHPIIVNSKYHLVAGRRRLAAAELLGMQFVPVAVCDHLDDMAKAIQAEKDENEKRLNLTPSQMKILADRLRSVERTKAEAREKLGKASIPSVNLTQGSQEVPSVNLTQGSQEVPSVNLTQGTGRVNEIVAKTVGTSRSTLEKIDKVVESGDQKVIDEMDNTGKVDPAYRKVTRQTPKPKDLPAILAGYKRTIASMKKTLAKKCPAADVTSSIQELLGQVLRELDKL